LGFISSNTFFKTGSGRPLREYLLREATLEGIVDFGDLQIFEGVTTYPAILTMKRGAAPKGHDLRFWKVDALPEANFQATWEKAAGPYPQSALGAGSWELENAALRALRDKIRTGRKTLKDVYGSPIYGIKTGLNAAFVIDNATKERLCNEDPRSADLLKPFLEGKDLKRWRAEPRDLWLIFTRRGTSIESYPAILRHLEQYRTALEPKPKGWRPLTKGEEWLGRKAGTYQWFEIQDGVDYHKKFTFPKIAYRDIAKVGSFHMDRTGAYLETTGSAIITSDKTLLPLLNSKVLWFYFTALTPLAQGGFFRTKKQYLDLLPIPKIDSDSRAKLSDLSETIEILANAQLSLQRALARRIPDLCPPGRDPKLTTLLQEWWTLPDFAAFRAEVKKVFKADIPLPDRSAWEDWITRDRAEIARLSAEIAAAEARIDRIVYNLFDLTPDEIALLESVV